MAYRLVGRAEARIDTVLLESARRLGVDAANRYNWLIFAAMTAIGNTPSLAGSREIPRLAGVRTFHLRSARRFVPREHRVSDPRHLVVYRVTADGTVEILSLVHDRMVLPKAARRAQRDAEV